MLSSLFFRLWPSWKEHINFKTQGVTAGFVLNYESTYCISTVRSLYTVDILAGGGKREVLCQ
jgi:hypothetical protein